MKKVMQLSMLIIGIACLGTSAFLFMQNQQSEKLAETSSITAVETLKAQVAEQKKLDLPDVSEVEIPEDNSATEATSSPDVIPAEPIRYLGILSIPALELELAVADTCTYPNLQKTPCAYVGEIMEGNLMIAAHNYKAHFGNINQLNLGDEAILLDMNGAEYRYHLTAHEIIPGDDVDSFCAGDWDLTLFTCLYGDNTKRVVQRFIMTSD